MTRTAADFMAAAESPKPEANRISQSPPPLSEKRSTLLSSFAFHISLFFFALRTAFQSPALDTTFLRPSPACHFSEYSDLLVSLCFPQSISRGRLTPTI